MLPSASWRFERAYGTLQGYAEQFLRLNGELHRQFVEHLFGIAVDDESDGLLGTYSSLVAVEQLVLGYL